MPSKLKETMVRELAAKFGDIDRTGCVVVGCLGLKARESGRARAMLLQAGARMTTVRNAMLSVALKQIGAPDIGDLLDGPSALITAEDAVCAARAAKEVLSGVSGLVLMGGYAEGRVLDKAGMERLADLPGRETLLSQTLTCIMAPAQQLVNCFAGVMIELAGLFEELRKKKEAESGGDQQQDAGE